MIPFIDIYGQWLRDKNKYAGFFEEILFGWITLTRQLPGAILRHAERRHLRLSHRIFAVFRGLLLDCLAARVKAAVAVFQNMGALCCRRMGGPI